MKKSGSNQRSLATASILGQPPSIISTNFEWPRSCKYDLIGLAYKLNNGRKHGNSWTYYSITH